MDPLSFLAVFAIGIIAAFMGNFAGGGGGLLSIPLLIFLGLPPAIAVATNKFGALGVCGSAVYKFSKAKKIDFKNAAPFIIISVIGAAIGANVLLTLDQALLMKIIGVIILLLLPAIFLKKDFGLKRNRVAKKGRTLGYMIYFCIAIYNGFMGAAAGLFSIFSLTRLFGYTLIESIALDKFVLLFNTIIAVIIFASAGIINYEFGIAILLGMTVGGYFGAKTAIDKGNKYVKIAFGLVVFASAIKLLFF
ncbi:MAG: sulfite exporter TauE/SafE family protein [Nanoarchaeota archaeon]|nr:sulfite exporter TauE/SafE family protein [Nanoarchaeota archaeon]MBU4124248.1 sulfite exporter TauE/SafE family protein [Nanoarchaeota archaeon]